jgi:hypothetical protein
VCIKESDWVMDLLVQAMSVVAYVII